MLLAALMLMTGMLGQAGHGWAHGGGEPAAAWLAALEAEHDWLASALADGAVTDGALAAGAEAVLQVFAACVRHDHGGGPAHQHDGPDGLLADHAHCVVFLLPGSCSAANPAPRPALPWAFCAGFAGAQPDDLDRPPRRAAAPA